MPTNVDMLLSEQEEVTVPGEGEAILLVDDMGVHEAVRDGMKNITPPDYAKRVENCTYRLDDACCHTLNYLRPFKCNDYCVTELDQWLRKEHPEMDKSAVVEIVTKLVEHTSETQ